MRRSLQALLLLLAPLAAGAQTQASADRSVLVARIDSLVASHLTAGPAPSVALAVVRGRDTIVFRGYGLAHRESRRAAGPTTIYEIGSLTKQYTAAAIMRLVEQGTVTLDDDLSRHVPSFPLQGKRVTIRQLLNHTSGIHSYTNSPTWRTRWADDLPPDSIVGVVARDTFDFAPGTDYRYNNTGYVLLGMVIERASGTSYADFLEREFFRPLGLRQTGYCPSRTTDTSFAAGYSRKDGAFVPAEYLSMTHPHAAGALCASVRDYLMWQRALHGGRVVSPASYAAMTTPDTLPSGRRHNYGFGLSVTPIGSHRAIVHSGGINGFATMQAYLPAESLSVIAFTNTDAASPGPLTLNIARAVLGLPLMATPTLPPVVALPAAERDRLPGSYDLIQPNGKPFTIRVWVKNDALVAQAEGPGQGEIPLRHLGNLVFGAAFDPSLRFTFLRDGDRVTGARLVQGGATLEGKRRE